MEQNNLVFEVDGTIYELVYNFKKLRLTGFILTKDNNNPKNINNLEDYILEYCNFGAPFFVVKKRNS